jgi:O-antigen/teichoic acid export membrane protein
MKFLKKVASEINIRLQALLIRPGIRLSVGKILAGVISATWLILLVRKIDKNEFATVVVVLAFSALTSVLHDGGQLMLLAKAVAIKPEFKEEISFIVFKRRVILALISLSIVTIIFSHTGNSGVTPMFLIWPSVLATVGYSTIFAVLRVSGIVDLEAKNEFFSRLVLIISGITMLSWGLSATKVIALYSAVDVLSFIVIYKKNRHLLGKKIGVEARTYTKQQLHWRVSSIVTFSSAIGLLLARTDPIFISALRRNDEVATFSVGLRFVEFLIVPVGTVLALKIANFSRTNSTTEIFSTVKSISVYSVSAVLVLQILASIMPFVFGSDYANAETPLRILAFSVVPMSLGSIFISWLTIKSPPRALAAFFIGLMCSVTAHLILTSKYGPSGAAFANLIANTTMATAAYFFFKSTVARNLKIFSAD